MPVTHLWAGCGLQISEVQPFGGFHKCILVANFCSLEYGTVKHLAPFAWEPWVTPHVWLSGGRLLGQVLCCPHCLTPQALSAYGKPLGPVGMCASDLYSTHILTSQHSSLSPRTRSRTCKVDHFLGSTNIHLVWFLRCADSPRGPNSRPRERD